MGILCPIVEPSASLLSTADADLFHCRGIGAKPIGHDGLGAAIFLDDALQKLQRRSLVPLRGDHGFQELAFVIDSPPEIAGLAIDLHERLIQAPAPLRIAPHVRYPLLPDLGSEDGAKPAPPKPDCLVADVDPALAQQVLDVAQRQRVLHLHHYRQANYLWRTVEISERVAHDRNLPQTRGGPK